jgi:hypothetical protein
MTELSSVGRTLLSDAFEFDFDLALLCVRAVKSNGQEYPLHTS